MVKLLIGISGLSAAMAIAALPPQPADAMARYKWQKRPLLVFAPAPGSPKLARQLAVLRANRGGFRDRDMVVVVVAGERVSMAMGAAPRQGATALRRRYGIARGTFRTILVGKDGGAKLTSAAPVSASRLFRLIDSMPMRRQEMQRRGS